MFSVNLCLCVCVCVCVCVPDSEYDRDILAARRAKEEAEKNKVTDAKLEAVYDAKIKEVKERLVELRNKLRRRR